MEAHNEPILVGPWGEKAGERPQGSIKGAAWVAGGARVGCSRAHVW